MVFLYMCGNGYLSFFCLLIDGLVLGDLIDMSWLDNLKDNCNFREGWVGNRFVIILIFDFILLL